MCLYPRLIKNKRYEPTQKNGGNPTICKDYRTLYVPVGCGNCIECRRQKAHEWQIRLNEEIKVHKYMYFVTLTFSEDALNMICNKLKTSECNAVAGYAVRHFLERWRKIHKRSIKHWLITELGHDNTERIHLHGLLFWEKPISNEKLTAIWSYGRTDTGKYVNERTINYIIKYVTKIDNDHKGYKAEIFSSAGIGRRYVDQETNKVKHTYIKENTREYYTLPNGNKCSLPIYYRNILFTDEERQKLWIDRLNKDERYINGIRIRNASSKEGLKQIKDLLKEQQELNIKYGYGDLSKQWDKKEYNARLKDLYCKEDIAKLTKS